MFHLQREYFEPTDLLISVFKHIQFSDLFACFKWNKNIMWKFEAGSLTLIRCICPGGGQTVLRKINIFRNRHSNHPQPFGTLSNNLVSSKLFFANVHLLHVSLKFQNFDLMSLVFSMKFFVFWKFHWTSYWMVRAYRVFRWNTPLNQYTYGTFMAYVAFQPNTPFIHFFLKF